jgi:hypothetical protein
MTPFTQNPRFLVHQMPLALAPLLVQKNGECYPRMCDHYNFHIGEPLTQRHHPCYPSWSLRIPGHAFEEIQMDDPSDLAANLRCDSPGRSMSN